MTHDITQRPVYSFSQHQAAVKALSWCPWKPNVLATGGGTADRHIRVWNVNNGSNLYSVDTKSQVCAILWSKEYNEMISAHGYSNNELILWKYPGMTKVGELTGHTARVLGMVMSPDGSTVCSVGADETLRFWECFQVDTDRKKKAEVNASKQKLSNNPMRLCIR
jgi:cell division cycle protein 20 (cofactor of APC complex)